MNHPAKTKTNRSNQGDFIHNTVRYVSSLCTWENKDSSFSSIVISKQYLPTQTRFSGTLLVNDGKQVVLEKSQGQ